jgi:hypothetical protein
MLRTAAPRRPGLVTVPLIAAAMLALWLVSADGPAPSPYYAELTVDAIDPAGPFTLTLHHGRLVAGSLDGVAVPSHRLRQSGDDLHIMHEDGSVLLALKLEPPGVVRWQARAP